MRTERSFTSRVEGQEDRTNTADDLAAKMLDKVFELQAPIEGLSRTVGGECACVAGLVMQSRYASDSLLLWPCQRVKARSARRYALLVNASVSRGVLLHPVRLLEACLIMLRFCNL